VAPALGFQQPDGANIDELLPDVLNGLIEPGKVFPPDGEARKKRPTAGPTDHRGSAGVSDGYLGSAVCS
jgi:hypothetical protein